MTDTRTRREKLAAMASQTASPREAENAARLLEAMPKRTTLSREEILAAPDLRRGVGSKRVFNRALHVVVVIDEDDALFSDPSDWDGVE